jgi:osmotically-inducible protein OsmY
MTLKLAYGCCTAILAITLACSNNDRQRAREKAEEAKRRTRQEAERARKKLQELGQEAKREARKVDQNVDQALRGGPSSTQNAAGAKEKLNDAGRQLHVASQQAEVKLDRAGMIAKVKTKLATDVGLSTATTVNVDATGHVVTLRGTVSSEEQKQQAEQAVMQLNGVTKVINLLQVQP